MLRLKTAEGRLPGSKKPTFVFLVEVDKIFFGPSCQSSFPTLPILTIVVNVTKVVKLFQLLKA